MSLLIILFSVTCNWPLRTPLFPTPTGSKVVPCLSSTSLQAREWVSCSHCFPLLFLNHFSTLPSQNFSFWSFEYSLFWRLCSPLTLTRLIYVHFIICKLCLNRANLKIQKGRKISILGFRAYPIIDQDDRTKGHKGDNKKQFQVKFSIDVQFRWRAAGKYK